jgi:hypothetical protein
MKAFSFARPALRASLALAALVAAACPSPFSADTERRRAIIVLGDAAPEVEVPATATVGAPFTVKVTSYGGGCVRADRTEVGVSGSVATVEPYQVIEKGRACTADLRTDVNIASIRFDTPGTAKVVFRGLNNAANEVITVERTVQVQ